LLYGGRGGVKVAAVERIGTISQQAMIAAFLEAFSESILGLVDRVDMGRLDAV
jgi:hypothetical protein